MKNIEFKLENIKLIKSEIVESGHLYDNEFSEDFVKIKIIYDFNKIEDFIQTFVHIEYNIEKKGSKFIKLGHFDILFTFYIKNINDIYSKEDLKKFLLIQLIRISYSSCRGIIFSETKGFKINDYYLNPVPPLDIYNSYIERKNQKNYDR